MAVAAPAAVSTGAGQGKEYPGGLTLYVLLTCAVAATGGLVCGYDIGISGKHRPQAHRVRSFVGYVVVVVA
jgi:hypothetical protein